MQPSDFSPAAPGRVVKVHTGFWAYVPNPLSPPLDSTWQLAGLAAEAHRSKRLLDLRETYRDRLQSARTSALLLRLVDELFAAPAVTIPRAAALLDVTHPQLNVDKLVGASVLHEAGGRRRNRIFMAREIVATLEQGSTQ